MIITSHTFVQGNSNQSRPFCGVSWLIIQSAFPGLVSILFYHIRCFGLLLMLVWEGPHWLLAGGFVSHRLWHIALRVNLEPHPSPIYIIDRWPCAQHLIIIMGLLLSGFPCVRRQHTLSHMGFVQYLDFHLTLSVDISPLCQLSLLVGLDGFYRALASSCACRKHTSGWLIHFSSSDSFQILACGLHSRWTDMGCLNVFLLANLFPSTLTRCFGNKV